MSVVKGKIKHFTDSIKKSLSDKNYYAALTTALILPDICSKLENPEENTNQRYPKWFDEYVGEKYIFNLGIEQKRHVFLSGQDAYALRCSVLHQGELDVTKQSARKNLGSFIFLDPSSGNHMNQINNILQLQVNEFCEDICEGVEEWLRLNQENHDINSRAANIMEINKSIAIW